MNSSSVAATAPMSRSASRSSWARRMLRGAGDDGLAVVPAEVGHHQRGAGQPRQQPQRGEVRRHHHVAVAGLPARHRVAVDGVHVDVDGQQVVAALGAVRGDVVDEQPGRDPFAGQPALHVGERRRSRCRCRRRRPAAPTRSATACRVVRWILDVTGPPLVGHVEKSTIGCRLTGQSRSRFTRLSLPKVGHQTIGTLLCPTQ